MAASLQSFTALLPGVNIGAAGKIALLKRMVVYRRPAAKPAPPEFTRFYTKRWPLYQAMADTAALLIHAANTFAVLVADANDGKREAAAREEIMCTT
ncbi:hypothetical protein [Herbaspirillum lusitanum]|uniref:hypothetical protein n=1 Tax=Herbaspirillum lusitanum TaxID=213312 RepID=UPI0022374349|nr:hypothetical protein [Herbaspirillum lusitanum]